MSGTPCQVNEAGGEALALSLQDLPLPLGLDWLWKRLHSDACMQALSL